MNDDQTRIICRPGGETSKPTSREEATRILNQMPPLPHENQANATRILDERSDGDRTVILGPTRRRKEGVVEEEAGGGERKDFMNDPTVGWLAVVRGPGAGGFVRLGYGLNSIGRGADQRCVLDFGDEKISRQNHAMLTYDPRGRKFYLQHGGGQNLTYLGEVPVLQPVELKGGEFLVIGNTVVRFVPLCGVDFDYPDAPTQPFGN